MKGLLLVFLGGGLGSALRYWIGTWLNSSGQPLPWGTFVVNVLGSFLIGLVLGFAAKNENLSTNTILLMATGFCGGFTTFSALASENLHLLKTGAYGPFLGYSLGSLLIGIIAVWLGLLLSKGL
ncbi:MAG: fluoride efflux transporter CrcB [Flavobacteriaceae bacterium]|nr:fluoride efflux transporter CrcB [Flavobacteriaceae bacterium]MDG1962325.1 fluoride efflux transporter CrcB [Flavobacteriaceae bacterium]